MIGKSRRIQAEQDVSSGVPEIVVSAIAVGGYLFRMWMALPK